MTCATAASPRHFSGRLVTAAVDCRAGLHRMEVHLVDDHGQRQVVYLAYGRGDAAARSARAQLDCLTVGARYRGSATLMRRTAGLTEWGGHVPPLVRISVVMQAAA